MPDDFFDDYAWWCECFACEECQGQGHYDEDEYGQAETCRHCEGTGIEPGAPGYEGPPPI